MVKLSIADQLIQQLRHNYHTGNLDGCGCVVLPMLCELLPQVRCLPKAQCQSRRSCLATTGSKIFVKPDWKLHFEYRFAVDRF